MDSKFRILWFSNGTHVPTGYGTVTKNVVERLKARGWNIEVCAFWGLEGSALNMNGVRVYPKMFSQYGEDALKFVTHVRKPSLVITLYDIWVGRHFLPKLPTRWAAYVPIDHDPIPPPVLEPLRGSYQPIAMCKYGARKIEEAGLSSITIPHGCNTDVFKPLDRKKLRAKFFEKEKERFENAFIVGVNAANKGLRKDFPRMLAAFRIFLDRNPEAKKDSFIYLNTWLQFPEGMDINALVAKFGLQKHAIIVDQWKKYTGMSEQEMAEFYSTCDVFLNLARGEGFGLPIIESQACGIPSICTDFSSMTELVKGHGWLIPYTDLDMTFLQSYMALANVGKAATAIEEAYKSPTKTRNLGTKSRAFALAYDYEKKILPLWENWLSKVEEESTKSFEMPNVLLKKGDKLENKPQRGTNNNPPIDQTQKASQEGHAANTDKQTAAEMPKRGLHNGPD